MHLDAIFYPCLTYNVDEGLGDNHYNCPVVAYYPEVLAGNCPELEGKKFIYDYVGIHRPKDFVHKMAKNVLPKYFGGISEKEVQEAADAAYAEYEAHMAKIRVKGSESDVVAKFFATWESAVLFPEYVARAVRQGMEETDILPQITAAETRVSGMDYRSIASTPGDEAKELKRVEEGAVIPETQVKAQENLVRLHKRGRMLVASYEAIQFQRLDLFSVTLRQIGAYINRMHAADAIDVLMNGDGNNNAAQVFTVGSGPISGTAGTLSYDALVDFWSQFAPYALNTLVVGDAMADILKLKEMQDGTAGLTFQGTGKLVTPMGATLVRSSAVPAGTILGLDKNYALELVRASDVLVEYDKLIDRQLERAAITSISGFAKIFQDAAKVLKLGG